ncbi:MAG TPA: PD-(D/E)XK nuclease family protein [Anaerolineales bacterium]|nr:PD-(D/E)XK nuclease family protein [Anaerolineales bacterium]
MPDNQTTQFPPAFTFSQTSLQDYMDCPRRFQLRYIEQLQWPAVETEPVLENERRQQEGQLFHRLVQRHLLGLPVEKLSRLANSPDLARWWENYLGAVDLKELHEPLRLSTEVSLVAPVGESRLLAKYDLLAVEPGNRAVIYDWKTYHKRPRDEWMAARMQTRVYRALLVQAGASLNGGKPFEPEQVEMVYWYADFPTEPARFPYTAGQYKRDWDALAKLIREISHHAHFPLTDDEKKCAFCPYRSYCNRGGKAGTGEESEAELEAASPDFNLNFEQIAEIEF